MFKAARQFCATTHAVQTFPRLQSNAPCPLCQNPVGEAGAARLIAFDEFIEGEATKAAEKARRETEESHGTSHCHAPGSWVISATS